MEEKKFKIIIADNNKEFRDIIRDFILLKQPDMFEVIVMVEDGAEAIKAVKKYEPDILILDAYAGKDILEELKSMRIKREVKIFLLSALADNDTAGEIIDIGVNYHLVKPFDFNLFLDALILISKMRV